MKQVDIEKILAEDLGRAFARDGFTYVKATKWLARRFGDLTHILSCSYYSSVPGFRVAPALAVRSEAIFDIFRQVNPIRPEDEKFRRTLNIELWRLSGDRTRGEFRVTSTDEAHQAAVRIESLARSDALPFLERCTSVADVDRLLNTDPNAPATRLLLLDTWTRAATALIAAKLAHNPNYEGCVAAYRAMLAEVAGGHYLRHYEELVLVLSKFD